MEIYKFIDVDDVLAMLDKIDEWACDNIEDGHECSKLRNLLDDLGKQVKA